MVNESAEQSKPLTPERIAELEKGLATVEKQDFIGAQIFRLAAWALNAGPDLLREVKRQAGEIVQHKFAADRQADEILELRGKVNHLQSRLEMAGRVAELEAEVDNLKAQICALKFEREMGGRHV